MPTPTPNWTSHGCANGKDNSQLMIGMKKMFGGVYEEIVPEIYQQVQTPSLVDSPRLSEGSADLESTALLSEHDSEKPLYKPNRDGEGEATLAGSFFNIFSNVVGSGLLVLPWAFSQAHIIPGIFLFAIACFCNIYSMLMLGKCCQETGAHSYVHLSEAVFSSRYGFPPRTARFLQLTIQVMITVYAFGAAITRIVLVGDFIPQVFGFFAPSSFLTNRTVVILLTCFLVLTPLSSLKNLNGLRFTSVLSFICCIYTTGVIVESLAEVGHPVPSVKLNDIGVGILIAFPCINVAFTAHYNSPKYYFEMKKSSFNDFRKVTFVTFVTALLMYIATGLSGYFCFGEDTFGDVLKNFPTDDAKALSARLVLAIAVALCFPMDVNALRFSLDSLVLAKKAMTTNLRCLLLSFAIVLITMIVAIESPEVEVVISYNGFFAICVSYVFPAFMYARVFDGSMSLLDTIMVRVLMFLGVFGSILGVVIITIRKINHDG